MTKEKILAAIELYESELRKLGIEKIDFPHDQIPITSDQKLGHGYGMLDQMREFAHQGRIDKVNRWIGFVQGILWCEGQHCLNDLKDHNRS
jgi:hypothetical protein